jgi:hypothetical protein
MSNENESMIGGADIDPCPILVIQPIAETWIKDRLAPMIRDTPALRNKRT